MEYSPKLKIEKKIYSELNIFFKELGYITPKYWDYFKQNENEHEMINEFSFQFDCFKNKFENPSYPLNAEVCIFKRYGWFLKISHVEKILEIYIKSLEMNKVNIANIFDYTVSLNFESIVAMDKSKILKFYDYREPKPHYLIENITELTNKILAQINTVIIPFSEKLQSIHYLDSVVNKSITLYALNFEVL